MSDEVIFYRVLRPHRALSLEGQKTALYVLLVLSLVLAPAIMASGLWVLLIFLLSPVAMLLFAFRMRNKATQLREELTITREKLLLERYEANGEVLSFETQPYWVKIEIHDDGPVEDYLTLKDQSRHVELGAFLDPEARRKLYNELHTQLAKIR